MRVFTSLCLLLISLSFAHAQAVQKPVFVSGEGGYHTYRIPAVIVTQKGTVLAFCEGRKNGRGDSGNIDLVLRRSYDGGKTWEKLQVVWDDASNTCGNPCPVVEQSTGRIYLHLTHNLGSDTEKTIVEGTSKGSRTAWVCHSDDDGVTWTKPVDITKEAKKPDWTWYASGPGVGIQTRTGRLVIPCDNKVKGTQARQAHVVYSDDKGATWKLGGVAAPNCNESQVVELRDGTLMLNIRSYEQNNRRLVALSRDGGATWSKPREDSALIEPVCQASILRYPGNNGPLLFSNPASKKREKMTVRLSRDEGKTWPAARILHAGPAAYSCLTVLKDGTIGCLYERGEKHAYETITFATFSLDWLAAGKPPATTAIDLGTRRELFLDRFLIDQLQDAVLTLERPRDEGVVLRFEQPWEGRFCAYCTVLKDGPLYRLYYRGMPTGRGDGSAAEVTCYAESKDGHHWVRPKLGLFEVNGSKDNAVILAGLPPFSHNFCPMIDTRPDTPRDQRYKALAGSRRSGLCPFVSPDGIHWRKLGEQPVITEGAFDSQNVPFWSESEQCYLCYFRVFVGGIRRIARTNSKDFLTWTKPVLMEYGDRPVEHLYTNQTHPYFRAPHLYISLAARFMPGRQVLTPEEAKHINVDPRYFKDCSDGVLQTTRGGNRYERTFMEGFLTPGIGLENWVSRTNYPALGVVQTGPTEMSFYANLHYGQPTAHLRRYSLRLDGFGSVTAPYTGGELLTKPLTFTGKELALNFATSAAGGIRVEIQDEAGRPIPGFTLADSVETIGNEIDRAVRWQGGSAVSRLAGTPVRLRFLMRDARLYSLQFRSAGGV